jgi:integrase
MRDWDFNLIYDFGGSGDGFPPDPSALASGLENALLTYSGLKNHGLDPVETRALLDSIDTSTVIGLRDRALIGLMVYSFARIGAALGMTVEDVFTQNRRLWVRLREKGGKRHAMPCHHNLKDI